ncbi:MAG: MgtC/SapB family protein [Clostridia bacterium]|nr:MgtC/SapB family protein [Clostridia bacterium]
MLIAGLCGLVIGIERKNRAKEAGLRTHFMVSTAAALMMIVSMYGFNDPIFPEGTRVADPTRIAAQIVSGVGFLGAGMIFVHKNTINGLTTAAGIWATAGIGMAVGAGMYIIGIVATIFVLLAQIILHMDRKWLKAPKLSVLRVNCVNDKGFQRKTVDVLKELNISVGEVSLKKNKAEGTTDFKFTVEIPPEVTEEDILNLFDYDASIDAD